ncbi:STN domain-containing protein [Pelagicoccus sp. SDUM812005]|uniref:STN domain-containing protein n=1 Tax=Pelagicoccus sp. SDUM812005 TaxID=3041257 RepID=UPI00280F660B|nr:STN domain-containing protein [Pelagicoccus sp. SDUM812005]MDQ8181622.1 STN domain-containing protein [Pelagicoccus sp. SDUM812005]
MVMLGCAAEKERVSLDVPAGDAVKTLKEFARQTEVEIVYDLQSVNGVRTNAVSGRYDPEVALRIMVRGTPLQVDYERETGAYAVFREKS